MTNEPTTGSPRRRTDLESRAAREPGDLPRMGRSPLTFERAAHEDLIAVSELLLRAIPDCVPQTVDQLWEREAETWVARRGDQRVVASASLVPLPGDRWELRSVVVDPSARGTGVGQKLVAHLLDRRSVQGNEICCVTRHPRFFRRLGFEPLGTPWETGRANLRGRQRIAMHRRPRRRLP